MKVLPNLVGTISRFVPKTVKTATTTFVPWFKNTAFRPRYHGRHNVLIEKRTYSTLSNLRIKDERSFPHRNLGTFFFRVIRTYSLSSMVPVYLTAGFFSFLKLSASDTKELSWDNLMSLAKEFEVACPWKRNEAAFSQLKENCFDVIYKEGMRDDWKRIDKNAKLIAILTNEQGDTLLNCAIERYEDRFAASLIHRKIGLERKSNMGETPIQQAIRTGQYEIISQLIQKDVDLQVGKEKEGGNILHWAVWCGQFKCIDYLFNQPFAKVNELLHAEDHKGRTPVSLAAYLGEVYSLNMLVEYGGNVYTKGSQGQAPIHWACMGKQKQSIDCLARFEEIDLAPYDNQLRTPEDMLLRDSTAESLAVHTHLKNVIRKQPQKKEKAVSYIEFPPENLVFKGGGVKGLAYIGVMQALEEKKVLGSLKRISGSSAGAINAVLVAFGYTSEEMSPFFLNKNFKEFLDHPEQYQIVQAAKILWHGHVHEGEVFRKWINDTIRQRILEKTGEDIPLPTFGDLNRLVKQDKYGFHHLYVTATRLGDQPKAKEVLSFSGEKSEIVVFSSEDPKCHDYIISDAIRCSISIPYVFRPHQMRARDHRGEPKVLEDLGYHVDGGVFCNFPNHFDKKAFKATRTPEEKEAHTWYNPRTWGFSLESPEPDEAKPFGSSSYFKSISLILVASLLDSESIIKRYAEDDRVITIDNLGVKTTEELSPERQDQLCDSGRQATQAFLKNYKKGQIGISPMFFDYGRFSSMQANGRLFAQRPHPDFLDREEQMQALENTLLHASWKQKTRKEILVGPPGYGKSQLAFAFAFTRLDKFSLIWQIDFRNPETRDRSVRKLAQALGIFSRNRMGDEISLEDLVDRVIKELENHSDSKPWLLILDNVDEQLTLPLPTKGGCILVTSQIEHPWDRNDIFRMPPFSPKDSSEFLEMITDASNKNEIKKLGVDLGHIPLFLSYAAHYIAHTPGFTIAKYRESLFPKGPHSFNMSSKEEPVQLLVAQLNLSFERLQQLQPDAAQWIFLSAYLNNQGIPKQWVSDWLKQKNPQDSTLQRHVKANECLNLLKRFALVYSDPYSKTFSLHGLLQTAIYKTQENSQEKNLKELIPIVLHSPQVADYNPTHEETIHSFQDVLPHCIVLLDHAKRVFTRPQKDCMQLALIVTRYYLETERNLLQAEKYLEMAKSWSYDLKHPILGRIAFLSGMANRKKASMQKGPNMEQLYRQSLADFEEARTIFQQHSEPKDYERLEQNSEKCSQGYQLATCLEYQAQNLFKLGAFDEAYTRLEKAHQEFNTVFQGKEHFDIARILRDKGVILWKEGNDVNQAKTKVKQAIAMQKRVYGDRFNSQPAVAATHRILGEIYLELKEFHKADAAFQQALDVNCEAYKTENHPYTVRVYRLQAKALIQLGENKRADTLIRKADEIDAKL